MSLSVHDFSGLLAEPQRRGWAVAFSETAIDTTTPAGSFTANVIAAAAEFERSLISARTREGMAQRRAEGAIFGIVVEDSFRPTYKLVLDLHASGLSMNKIAAKLTADGVPTAKGGRWYASTVRGILTSETAKTL